MSEEKGLKPKGFIYKATEFLLGIASVGALVLSFIPGANLIGAGIQGAITIVQTGMDLVTSGVKKAALTFATGAAFTAVSVVPFLGAAGKTAKGISTAAHVAEEAGHAGQAVGFFGKVVNFFKPVTDVFKKYVSTPVGNFFSWMSGGASKVANKIPGVTQGVNKLKGWQRAAENATVGYLKDANNSNSLVTKTANILGNEKAKMAAEVGLMGTSVGLGMIGGNTTPPNVLANPDLYASNKSDETPDAAWAKRIEAERAARGPGAPSVA